MSFLTQFVADYGKNGGNVMEKLTMAADYDRKAKLGTALTQQNNQLIQNFSSWADKMPKDAYTQQQVKNILNGFQVAQRYTDAEEYDKANELMTNLTDSVGKLRILGAEQHAMMNSPERAAELAGLGIVSKPTGVAKNKLTGKMENVYDLVSTDGAIISKGKFKKDLSEDIRKAVNPTYAASLAEKESKIADEYRKYQLDLSKGLTIEEARARGRMGLKAMEGNKNTYMVRTSQGWEAIPKDYITSSDLSLKSDPDTKLVPAGTSGEYYAQKGGMNVDIVTGEPIGQGNTAVSNRYTQGAVEQGLENMPTMKQKKGETTSALPQIDDETLDKLNMYAKIQNSKNKKASLSHLGGGTMVLNNEQQSALPDEYDLEDAMYDNGLIQY